MAVSSPPGTSAQAVLRLSGPRALALADARFSPAVSGRGAQDGALDVPGLPRVPATLYRMPGPGSYTGEDVAELHVPGNPALVRHVVERLLADGAEPAGPGEFSRRAFENGRLDLARAEAVAGLIAATDAAEARAAAAAAAGGAGELLSAVRDGLVELSGLLEAQLDFSDRDIQADTGASARAALDALRDRLGAALARPAVAAAECPVVVLFGRPNAGKSTLFNALLGRERAVTSPEPGTTRDPLRATAALPGGPVELVDPAGAGEATGPVDARAQARMGELLRAADLVLHVAPVGEPPAPLPDGLDVPVLAVRTHADLRPADGAVSAVTGEGLAELAAAIVGHVGVRAGGVWTSARQRAGLTEAAVALDRAAGILDAGVGVELAAFEVAEARAALTRIIDAVMPDDVLGAIFERFCIGK